MSRILRDLWIVVGMILSHGLLTALVVISLLYVSWSHAAASNAEVRMALEQFETYAQSPQPQNDSDQHPLGQGEPFVKTLLLSTPWGLVALVGSIVIFPFLGWWSGRLLAHPELGGLILLFTVVARQNIALIPKNIEYRNLAPVALSLSTVLTLLILQFLLFAGGLFLQQSSFRTEQTNQSEESKNEIQ